MGKILLFLSVLMVSAHLAGSQNLIWQSDLQIQSLSVSASRGHLVARVSVSTELGVAMATRVEVMLPVGVGIVGVGAGCTPGPSPPGVPSLRARVICTAGDLRPRDLKEFTLTTTTPPPGVEGRFGVMVMSDTPDPRPGNNFAEREIPRGDRPHP